MKQTVVSTSLLYMAAQKHFEKNSIVGYLLLMEINIGQKCLSSFIGFPENGT